MQNFLSFQMVLIETTKVLTYILVCIFVSFSMCVYNYNGIFKFTVRKALNLGQLKATADTKKTAFLASIN